MAGATIVAADDFHVVGGVYDWKPERVGYCHLKCQETVRDELALEVAMIVVHNTFTTESEMNPYFEMADEYGYTVRTLIVENRHGNTNIHNVPNSTLDKMERRFAIKLR